MHVKPCLFERSEAICKCNLELYNQLVINIVINLIKKLDRIINSKLIDIENKSA